VRKAVLKEANNISFNHCRPNSSIEDVRRIKDHPVPTNIPVYGYIFDVKSGKLIEILKQQNSVKQLKIKKPCFLKF
jgi:hypothetical protein